MILLIVGVGRGTKLLTHLVGADKTYEATIRLGATTVTEDAEGELTGTADPSAVAAVTDEQIRAAVAETDAPIASRESTTDLGCPVDPDVVITAALLLGAWLAAAAPLGVVVGLGGGRVVVGVQGAVGGGGVTAHGLH